MEVFKKMEMSWGPLTPHQSEFLLVGYAVEGVYQKNMFRVLQVE